MDGDFPNRMHVKVEAGQTQNMVPATGVLFLHAKFVEIDPGSSWARLFSKGFAGASHITIAGEFTDAQTGKSLLRFQHHNYHSGGALYTSILAENEEQIAGVLAHVVKAFYP